MSEILGNLVSALLRILGVGAIGVIAYQVLAADKTGNQISNLNQLNMQVMATYNGYGDFTNLTTDVAKKLAPTSMTSTGTLRNAWNGAMTVAVNGSNSSMYDVTDTNVPPTSCAKLPPALTGLTGLTVNGASQTIPADPGTMVTACSQATNTLVYTFSR